MSHRGTKRSDDDDGDVPKSPGAGGGFGECIRKAGSEYQILSVR
jgi:hypothetical protein